MEVCRQAILASEDLFRIGFDRYAKLVLGLPCGCLSRHIIRLRRFLIAPGMFPVGLIQ
jgi:hypothetical protein